MGCRGAKGGRGLSKEAKENGRKHAGEEENYGNFYLYVNLLGAARFLQI